MLLEKKPNEFWVERESIHLLTTLQSIYIPNVNIAEVYIWNSKEVREFISRYTSTDDEIEKALLVGEYRKYFNLDEKKRSNWITPSKERETMRTKIKYKLLNNTWGE